MRKIEYIFIHTDGPETEEGVPIAGTDHGVDVIRDYHVKHNGWDDIGYHFVLRKDGTEEQGRPLSIPGAHVYGHNVASVGYCFSGNGDVEVWTEKQVRTGVRRLAELLDEFGLGMSQLLGHREVNRNKTCPGELIDLDEVRKWVDEYRKRDNASFPWQEVCDAIAGGVVVLGTITGRDGVVAAGEAIGEMCEFLPGGHFDAE